VVHGLYPLVAACPGPDSWKFQFGGSRVHLVDEEAVGGASVGLGGVVRLLVVRPVRVSQDDVQVRNVKRQVAVPAVPKDDIGFTLGLAQDTLVIAPEDALWFVARA
jgi:hypothetical protein